MFALLITGPPGAGKNEVASALHDSLGAAEVDAALIEVDALERSYPPIDRDRAIAHLKMLADSYRELGTPVLLVTATLEDNDYRDAAVAAIGADDFLLARLEAEPDTLRERILAREPPGWGGLPDLLNSSRRLAEEMKALDDVDVVLSTEGRQPAEVAEELEGELRGRI